MDVKCFAKNGHAALYNNETKGYVKKNLVQLRQLDHLDPETIKMSYLITTNFMLHFLKESHQLKALKCVFRGNLWQASIFFDIFLSVNFMN